MRTSRLRLAAGPLHLLLWPLLRPEITGLRILARPQPEVLAPGASFRARTYPKVDILNLILEGEAEYRDSDGNHVQAKAGEALLIATQPGVSYSEHNLSKEQSLTRMQLWLDACPQRENPLQQKINVADATLQLLASPEGGDNSLQLRQQARVYHIALEKGEQINVQLHGPRAYLQSIHGSVHAVAQEQQSRLSPAVTAHLFVTKLTLPSSPIRRCALC